jgi:hypothetical protein
MASSLCLIAVIAISYCFLTCLYNLYLHPLSRFPGPKIATFSHIYEFYYDVIKDGSYLWQIEKMHRKYGMKFNSEDGILRGCLKVSDI